MEKALNLFCSGWCNEIDMMVIGEKVLGRDSDRRKSTSDHVSQSTIQQKVNIFDSLRTFGGMLSLYASFFNVWS